MLKYNIILVLIIFSVLESLAQEDDVIPEINVSIISMINEGNSYITFPTDIGNLEPLWFEANLNPSFHIRQNKDSRLMGVLTPQIIFRMYQEPSFPIRTPSFIPQITAYYKLISKTEANSLSIMGKFAHHSNGQDGEFYNEDGEINVRDGSFSTNYMEFGLIKTNYVKKLRAVQFFSTSLEIHPKGLSSDELDGMYGFYRWNSSFSIFKLPADPDKKVKRSTISIKGKTSWMFGELYDWNTCNINRLNISFTFFYHPKFLEEIGLFAHVYHGMDYYNIYFSHQITVLRFGIMTDKLRF